MDFYGYFNPARIQSGHFAWSSESRYFLGVGARTHTHTDGESYFLNNFHYSVGKQKSIIAFHLEAFFLSAEKKGADISLQCLRNRSICRSSISYFYEKIRAAQAVLGGGRVKMRETRKNFNYFTCSVIKAALECKTFSQRVFLLFIFFCIGTLVKV